MSPLSLLNGYFYEVWCLQHPCYVLNRTLDRTDHLHLSTEFCMNFNLGKRTKSQRMPSGELSNGIDWDSNCKVIQVIQMKFNLSGELFCCKYILNCP